MVMFSLGIPLTGIQQHEGGPKSIGEEDTYREERSFKAQASPSGDGFQMPTCQQTSFMSPLSQEHLLPPRRYYSTTSQVKGRAVGKIT